LRANDDLTVIRDVALALSLQETGALLARFGFDLPGSDVKLVHARSEGWVAGVQMAALSMQSSAEPLAVIRRMELRTGTVMRYFVEEVLERQPADIADFMLATSVLEELSPEACVALYGGEAGRLLQRVHRGNLFLVQLGGDEPTFRYHHLVRDILRAQLRAQDPDRSRDLHASSAAFLADQGHVYAAARQLFDAGDGDGALSLLSTMVGRAYLTDPDLEADESVSPSAFAGSPRLLEPLAAWQLLSGDFDGGAYALRLAEEAPFDPNEDSQLASDLAGTRSLRHLLVGEFEEALEMLARARALLPERTGLEDSMAGFLVLELGGLVGLRRLAVAREVAAEATRLGAPEPVRDVLCKGYLSRIALLEGSLREANRLARDSVEAAQRLGFDRHYSSIEAKLVLALTAYERGALPEAEAMLEDILRVVSGGRPMYEFLAQIARARIWAARGEFEPALASLEPARRALRSDRSPLLREADLLEAVLRIRLGDRTGAFDIAGRLPDLERGITIVRLALATKDHALASRFAADLPWAGTVAREDLQLRLLRASLALLDGSPRADRSVTETLSTAAQHGYLMTVLETTPGLADHVIAHPRRYGPADWVSALASASLSSSWQERDGDTSGRLVEQLTDAELRVLRCLPMNMTSSAMATYLNVSPNTIKTHLSHIYMKLDANSREAALERAMALGIL
jgi:LuxR family maltose regulon positive regulatory protein